MSDRYKKMAKDHLMKKFNLAGPPAADEPQEESLKDKYARLMADNEAVEQARADAADSKGNTTMIQGLAQMFGGKVNNGVFDSIRSQADGQVDAAKAAKDAKLKALLTGDKLGRQEVERSHADTQFGNSQNTYNSENNPNHTSAIAMRGVLKKQFGLDDETAKVFDGLSKKDMMSVAKQLTSQKTSGKRFSPTKIEVPGKGVFLGRFDTHTGKYSLSDHNAGFKYSIDNSTGLKTSGSTLDVPSTSITTDTGKTQRDLKIEHEGNLAESKKIGSRRGEATFNVAEAEAALKKRTGLSEKWADMYEVAQQEGGVGPVGGRAEAFLENWGYTKGENSARLASSMMNDINMYIKKITGAQLSEPEAKRLMAVMPSPKMTRELFEARMRELEEEAKRVVNERIDVQRRLTSRTPGEKTVVKKKYSPSRNKTKLIYSDGTEELVDGKQ